MINNIKNYLGPMQMRVVNALKAGAVDFEDILQHAYDPPQTRDMRIMVAQCLSNLCTRGYVKIEARLTDAFRIDENNDEKITYYGTMKNRIISVLRKGPKTGGEIAYEIYREESNDDLRRRVCGYLRALVCEGKVKKVREGKLVRWYFIDGETDLSNVPAVKYSDAREELISWLRKKGKATAREIGDELYAGPSSDAPKMVKYNWARLAIIRAEKKGIVKRVPNSRPMKWRVK
jgi:uncharacterized protein YueI